jgi:flagellar motor switch protein FliN/FliY
MSDDNETETGDGDLPLEDFDGEAAMAAAIAEEQAEAETNADEQAEAKASGDEEPVIQTPKQATDLQAVYDIPVQVSAVLGKATMQVSQLLKLGRGAVVELDRRVGEAIDIYVNNRLVARGEVVVVDERLGVTMTEIIKSDRSS